MKTTLGYSRIEENTEPIQERSQVAGELDILEKEAISLHAFIDELTDRLVSVLSSSTPENSIEKNAKPDDEIVILARTIRDIQYRCKSAKTRIQDILNRIQL